MISQPQMNAVTIINALQDLADVNTDPQYGYGDETLALIHDYFKASDPESKRAIIESIERIFPEFTHASAT